MFVKTVHISGLTPQITASLVHLASRYVSDIHLEYQDRKINAKSIMGILSLGSTQGEMTLTVEGPDEHEAIKAVSAAIEHIKTRPA